MTKTLIVAALLASAMAGASVASAATAASFYVAQDAKTHACSVVNAKPDGKMAMDVGTKAYDSQANAQKALDKLKACAAAPAAAAAAPAGFYVAEDAKTKKCMVSNTKPDGKMAMDVGTKMYDSEANAKKAMANIKVCK
jgi:uncharacterized protein YegP (UPF0339 family)